MRAKQSPNSPKSILEAEARIRAHRNAATPIDDLYTIGLLGPIIAELRNAQATIDELSQFQHTAQQGRCVVRKNFA